MTVIDSTANSTRILFIWGWWNQKMVKQMECNKLVKLEIEPCGFFGIFSDFS
jgi:hypothetical protein